MVRSATDDPARVRTDDQLAQLDVADMLERGLAGHDVAARRKLFGVGAICAAIALDRLDVLPRSLTFLAEVVRAGGAGYAADLVEPLPDRTASEVVTAWLRVAAERAGDGAVAARWLDAVAAVIDLRRRSRSRG